MREIKFRAWNEIDKKMLEPFSLAYLVNWYASETRWGEHRKDLKQLGFDQTHTVDGIYMQFTGLKDKNSTEIYEGDILKYSAKTKFAKRPYSVVFWRKERSGFCLEIIGKNVHPAQFNPKRPELKGLYQDILDDTHNEGFHEVVGNIYENPDLLPNPHTI